MTIAPTQIKPWTDLLAGALTPLLAILAAYIAWRQHHLDRLKARQSLYDRRLALFQSTTSFIARVTADGFPSNDEVIGFRRLQDEAYFLFGKEMADYMDAVFRKSLELRNVQRRLQGDRAATLTAVERQSTISQDEQLFEWFGEQAKDVRVRFAAYLRLPM